MIITGDAGNMQPVFLREKIDRRAVNPDNRAPILKDQK
jgi:hypothetical protein